MTVQHRPRTQVAFESARVSYSDHRVDFHNSGVNQLASLAAVRGHSLCHFRMADLYRHRGRALVRATRLSLDPDWTGDPLDAWCHVHPAGTENLELDAIGLYFVRGDDIRRTDTPNLEILREAEDNAIVLESVAATLATCDKYELVARCPDVPQPATRATSELDEALDAIGHLTDRNGWFVLKDRYGYGGAQVHRLRLDTPDIEHIVHDFLRVYGEVLVQEYRPEVADGDLVVTFFDDEFVGAMRRLPAPGEWKTNASLGAVQVHHELTADQRDAAWAVRRAFAECRLASVDLLTSGRVLEINSFPGAEGLLETHGLVLGERVLDRLEAELASCAVRAHEPGADP